MLQTGAEIKISNSLDSILVFQWKNVVSLQEMLQFYTKQMISLQNKNYIDYRV